MLDETILLTGATGYIGGRLLRRFEEGGRAVRCLARQPARLGATRSTTEVVQGDCLDEASLDRALAGVQRRVLPRALDGGGAGLRGRWTAAPPTTSDERPRAPACGASSILAD